MDHISLSELDEEDTHESVIKQPRFFDLRSKEAEHFSDLLDSHLPDEVIRWDCHEDIGWVFELEDLVLEVENYQFDAVTVRVSSGSMPRIFIDPLRQELRRILSTALASRGGMHEFVITLLQLLEEAVIAVHEWKGRGGTVKKLTGWDVHQVQAAKVVLGNSFRANVEAVDESISHLLGRSVSDICDVAGLSKLQILHAEPVFRSDLVRRLRNRQSQMFQQLMSYSYHELRECIGASGIPYSSALDNYEDLARELCRPRITFHGTAHRNIPSIVRWGFVLPGQRAGNQSVRIACGSSFGMGIYTSPEANYALTYAKSNNGISWKTRAEDMPSVRLIICAVLMGRPVPVTRAATRRTREIADPDAHSHISPNKCEYIVFDPAQVIPMYVVHLDFGVEHARRWLKQFPDDPRAYKMSHHPKLVDQKPFPGEVEAWKQAKKAAASKWFPYGYGPATGTSFIIEEIGAVSDDEEDYGEYQYQRKEADEEVWVWERGRGKRRNWFDEYQMLRKVGKHTIEDETK